MKTLLIAAATMAVTTVAFADTDTFDKAPVGSPPAEWTCGVTGQGAPIWKVEADPSAPSRPNVLRQSGDGDYLWCAKKDVSMADGFVEVKFKPLSGNEDQAGGVVWRWKDGETTM